jgi:peptide/nickel transport system ATP-binding protein
LAALPGNQERRGRLNQIPGVMPGLTGIPEGCPFHPRCAWAGPECRAALPELCDLAGDMGGVSVACRKACLESGKGASA